MVLKWIFDRSVALIGLLCLWPVLLVVAVMIKVKMPGRPVLFVQQRVGHSAGIQDVVRGGRGVRVESIMC